MLRLNSPAEGAGMRSGAGVRGRKYGVAIVCAAAFCIGGASPLIVQGETSAPAASAGTIFTAPLADVPGKHITVVALTLPPKGSRPERPHRHPGSVYVYVTQGVARLGIEGQPVREVRAGESFFEAPGVLHTVAESASATEPASAIAVAIVPDGAELVIPEGHQGAH